MAEPAVQLGGDWRARLTLGFRAAPGRTILAERHREGPLAVQRALYPEGDACHVYLLHPPGGVAGGDRLDIRCTAHPKATALLTTPGATKFYRSIGPTARVDQRLTADGGALEWLPQENILFPGAMSELNTRVDLNGNARFIGWEIHCLGRPVIGEAFDTGAATMAFQLYRDGSPVLLERQVIRRDQRFSGEIPAIREAAGLRGLPVFATLYATPADTRLLERLREMLPDPELGMTLVDGLLALRYLGDSVARANRCFVRAWEELRPAVIGRPTCAPRIWNT
jgi:urease accessory protein